MANLRPLWGGVRALIAALGLLLAARLAPATEAPAEAAAVLKQAANLVEWGRLKEARDLVAAAVAQPANAKNAPLTAYYSHLLMQFGDYKTGLDEAKRAIALDPNCATCHLYLFEALAERAKGYGQMRGLLQLPKLKKQLETAGQLDPNLGDVEWGWVDLDINLPPAVGGGLKEALTHANRLLQLDPVDGNLAKAQIYEAQHQPDQALAADRAAAAAQPDDPRGVFALGQALYERGDYAGAEAPLARAWALNHQSALYSGYEAAELVRLNRLPEARTVLDQAHAIHPNCRLGDFLAAQALKAVGQDFNWARELLRAYLAVPPEPAQPTADQARTLLAQLG